jgi:hypothetical protein
MVLEEMQGVPKVYLNDIMPKKKNRAQTSLGG